MKFEWRKHEKALYGAKSTPALVDIPKHSFIMMKGSGNPNDTDFSDRVGALFSLAYAIKMGYKSTATKNILSNEIHDFTVYPLEGIWKQKNVDTESAAGKLIKENLEYTIMIRQPDFITSEMVCVALERLKSQTDCMKKLFLIRYMTENVLKFCILAHTTTNRSLLSKWINLQKKTVCNAYQILIEKSI